MHWLRMWNWSVESGWNGRQQFQYPDQVQRRVQPPWLLLVPLVYRPWVLVVPK